MKIGVIGLGLIGGSIFKSLQNKYSVVGISRTVNEPNVSNDYNLLKDCELVFVCTPMNITLEVLDKLEGVLQPTTIVTDVCSLKSFVSKKTYSYKFIPSHPMAGTEHSGWESSFAELFKGAKWAITPINENFVQERETLEAVIKTMGADVIITTPEEHDKAVALISHLPMLVAQALCKNIINEKLAQELASSGFRDTTRLALSNLEMANDMIELNRNNILQAYETLNKGLESLLKNNYLEQVKTIKDFRKKLF
ncbi:prephenate dehydrogenase/arogenate dehydrogenase family protein [bacterium]|nr:prephenate dehydrogenase/arogenate dehydrogenase family protein [bacterium]